MKKYLLLAVVVFFTSCKKDETASDSNTDPNTNSIKFIENTFKYKSPFSTTAKIGLQFSFTDTIKHSHLYFYGTYNRDGYPDKLYFAQIEKDGNDTVFNFVFDDKLYVNALYFTIKNEQQPSPLVIKFSKMESGVNWMGIYQRNWKAVLGQNPDSLITETYFYDNGNIILTQQATQQPFDKDQGLAEDRQIYTSNGVDPGKVKFLSENAISIVKIAAGVVIASVGGVFTSSVLIWVGSAITVWGILNILNKKLTDVVSSANASEIQFSKDYPYDRIVKNKGDLISDFYGLDLYDNLRYDVLIYNPILIPSANGSDIKCNFLSLNTSYNYSGNKFIYDCCPSAVTNHAVLLTEGIVNYGTAFFDYKFDINNVTTTNSIISGSLTIRDILFIKNNWNTDSLRLHFKRISFYLGIGENIPGGGFGYGMGSNNLHLFR